MELTIPELDKLFLELEEVKNILTQKNNVLKKEWYTAKECWELKGGNAYSSYETNRYYQIKGGIPDAYVGGRKVWSRESVEEWLKITDDQLPEYHEKYKTGAKK